MVCQRDNSTTPNPLYILDELSATQLKKFKTLSGIPWGKLEKADVTDIVGLMESHYEATNWMSKTKQILKELPRVDLVKPFEESCEDFITSLANRDRTSSSSLVSQSTERQRSSSHSACNLEEHSSSRLLETKGCTSMEECGVETASSFFKDTFFKKNRKKKRHKKKNDNISKKSYNIILKAGFTHSLDLLNIKQSLYNIVGIVDIKKLKYGRLLVKCTDSKQCVQLLQLKELDGKKVRCFPWQRRKMRIKGIPDYITTKDIFNNVSGTKVLGINSFKHYKDAFILEFDEENLPSYIEIQYFTYKVKPYKPFEPVRCYKCNRLGHIAVVCRHKQRCGRCGSEDHAYGKCPEGTKVKCCNCEGGHSAAYKGCPEYKHAAKIQKVEHKLSCAYATKDQIGAVVAQTTSNKLQQRQSISTVRKEAKANLDMRKFTVESVNEKHEGGMHDFHVKAQNVCNSCPVEFRFLIKF
ncbi:uncharacterized protein LOC121700735 [Alosa sapidissima]|uniref:uncharacterized protein LOC121700735 n=1 Tax=Alosa sapidissima TaxID=34773 RepID=UPI001C085E5B|nr:uncharacterized protein LOC121700735 [Alosa sapidissima]